MRIEMKRTMALFTILLLASSFAPAGEKIEKGELKWRSFDTGFAEAKKTNRKILLDVYTDWCGWCKRLDKDVYANQKVAAYLNERYVVVKLNAESANKLSYRDTSYSEAGFAQSLGVHGYPTILFFDPAGELITSLGG